MSRQASYQLHVLQGAGRQINGLFDKATTIIISLASTLPNHATQRVRLEQSRSFNETVHRWQRLPACPNPREDADNVRDEPLLRALSLIVAMSGVVLLILGGWVAALDHFH